MSYYKTFNYGPTHLPVKRSLILDWLIADQGIVVGPDFWSFAYSPSTGQYARVARCRYHDGFNWEVVEYID